MKNLKKLFIAILAAVLLNACSPASGDFPGSEYMPDMAHSLAIEPNVHSYYYYNTWDNESTIKLKDLSNPRLPVQGTVARGYAGIAFAANGTAQDAMMAHLRGGSDPLQMAVPLNGSVPYYYADTDDERLRATAELLDNPFPITADGLARGKELYEIFCGICHGNNGGGQGYLVSEENTQAKYPAAPANFLNEEFSAASNGRYYHAIIYGKNVMGGYTDKISYEERWQVVHYIRALQAADKKLVYSEEANTLNAAFGVPGAQYTRTAQAPAIPAGPVSDQTPPTEGR